MFNLNHHLMLCQVLILNNMFSHTQSQQLVPCPITLPITNHCPCSPNHNEQAESKCRHVCLMWNQAPCTRLSIVVIAISSDALCHLPDGMNYFSALLHWSLRANIIGRLYGQLLSGQLWSGKCQEKFPIICFCFHWILLKYLLHSVLVNIIKSSIVL